MERHRTQLYLDQAQYRWLRRRAGSKGSIAAVVRELIDAARNEAPSRKRDPLITYLADEPAARGREPSSVTTLDEDLYGA